jgi:C1A family cysteine protease
MPLLRCYGWRRDDYDPRDYIFHTTRSSFPGKVDLRELFPAAYNQRKLHSCIGNAIGAAIQFEQRRQTIEDFLPSRLFIYYNARAAEHATRKDHGARIRDAMKAVAKHGVPPEIAWPYLVHKFALKPGPRAYRAALDNRVTEYLRLHHDVKSMRACLADGYPFVFGLMLYESFESHKVRHTGIVSMPSPAHEKTVGGHAMLCVGYDDDEKVFIVRNSWGADWGKEGYCFIPYHYLQTHKLTEDFWTVRMVSEKQATAEKARSAKATAAYVGKA